MIKCIKYIIILELTRLVKNYLWNVLTSFLKIILIKISHHHQYNLAHNVAQFQKTDFGEKFIHGHNNILFQRNYMLTNTSLTLLCLCVSK